MALRSKDLLLHSSKPRNLFGQRAALNNAMERTVYLESREAILLEEKGELLNKIDKLGQQRSSL